MIRKFTSIEEVTNLMKDDVFKPQIALIGIGGAGTNALNNMISMGLSGVKFAVINTDAQSLENSIAPHKLQIGPRVTKGLGAGSKPEIGIQAAKESIEDIKHILQDVNMLFIACGMGGGTGTGASQVVAQIAKDMGILSIAFVTTPFGFEGNQRADIAHNGVKELEKYVDSLLIISNENLFNIIGKDTPMVEAFRVMDSVLYSSVKAIVDLIASNGLVNLDFNDIKSILEDSGRAMIGSFEASGENRADIVVKNAMINPLLEDMSLEGARKALINITGGDDMTLYEVHTIIHHIKNLLSDDAFINFGTVYDGNMQDTIRVSIVATGLEYHLKNSINTPKTNRILESNLVQNSMVVNNMVKNLATEIKENIQKEDEQPAKISTKIQSNNVKEEDTKKLQRGSDVVEFLFDNGDESESEKNPFEEMEEDSISKSESLFDLIAKKNSGIRSNNDIKKTSQSAKEENTTKESTLFELPSFLKKK